MQQLTQTTRRIGVGLVLMVYLSAAARASDLDLSRHSPERSRLGTTPNEFRVKREQVFGFVGKPGVTRDGDEVTISFESKGFCDATVAIENANGRIIRHLASGVLGSNAPAPFQKNSKQQILTWDGKDDRDRYVDDRTKLSVRVSLGLKPRFERSLLWTPKRRISGKTPLMAASEEGVYVYQGQAVDHIRLYDHKGDYARTVYPFPAGKITEIADLERIRLPQLEHEVPLKRNAYKNTLFTCGENGGHCLEDQSKNGLTGNAGVALAVHRGKIALAGFSLNRAHTDGTSGGLDFNGPNVSVSVPSRRSAKIVKGARYDRNKQAFEVMPRSIAFSPDGKWLYLTGYQWIAVSAGYYSSRLHSLHGVMRMPYRANENPTPFLGKMHEAGKDDHHFSAATSVDCDGEGRVYVSDYLNNRIQVFSSYGKHLKAVPVERPSKVRLNRKTGDLYMFSWMIPMVHHKDGKIAPILHRFSPYPECRSTKSWTIPGVSSRRPAGDGYAGWGRLTEADIDFWAAPPTVWLSGERSLWAGWVGSFRDRTSSWRTIGPRLLAIEDDKLVPSRDFVQNALEASPRLRPARASSQYLFVNPKTGKLLVAEATGRRGGAERTNALMEIDPETGSIRTVKPPFNPADLAFDLNGLAYARIRDVIVRYDPATWREIPWDYGEERKFDGGRILSGLAVPLNPMWIWQGGLAVSPRGDIAVHYPYRAVTRSRKGENTVHENRAFVPHVYPGRPTGFGISIWDRHGKLVCRDALPGIGKVSGIALDSHRNVTAMAGGLRMWNGKPYPIRSTATLLQGPAGRARVLSSSDKVPVPLPAEIRPGRPQDMKGLWLEGGRWLYGGVGYNNSGIIHCFCWHSRFAQDWFGRSFVPEPDIFRVAVLDSNGNLILRVGQYGNVDDGKPLVADGGPPSPRSIGGDEVALFQPNYLGTHTDRRLLIADAGNSRVVSVRTDYHAEHRLRLTDINPTKE